ncbi:MAG: DUF503 domain-containing protein [Chloroflexi bacterium]|nr:MAG: DUF503 domain-containing protein [Chloroflexota bacterium]
MIIGTCRVELHLPGNGSLKGKRSRLRPLLNRLHKEFNVATAEVDHQDLWQSARIALVTVSTDVGHVQRVLERAVHWIEVNRPDLMVVDWEIEIF